MGIVLLPITPRMYMAPLHQLVDAAGTGWACAGRAGALC